MNRVIRALILGTLISACAIAQQTTPIISVGIFAPNPGTCNAVSVGNIYVQSQDTANGPVGVSRCTQTGFIFFSWQPIDHLVGTSLPATCNIGAIFFKSDAGAGSNLYGCTALNTWNVQAGGGGGGSPGGTNGQVQINSSGTFGGFTPGGDVSFSSPNFSVIKIGGVAVPTSGVLKGGAGPSITQAASTDVIGLFSGTCTGTNYLGADGACHVAAGGSGSLVITTGAGAPSANCAAPSSSNLAEYFDTTNQDTWFCYATNSWKKFLAVTGTGPYVITGGTGAAPSTPSAGTVSCYFDSTTNTQICLDSSSNAFTMVKGTSATTHQFLTNVDVAGIQHQAAIGATDIPNIATPTPGTSITLAAPGGSAICTANCTITVPLPTAGAIFCAGSDNNASATITFSALGGSGQYQNQAGSAYGTSGTGTLSATAAVNNRVCIYGRDTTHYLFWSGTGTWSVN